MIRQKGKRRRKGEQALSKINPDSPAFLDSLGWVYYKLGLMSEARSFIKRAYDKSPSNPEISEHYTIVSTETHGPGVKEKSSQGGKK